jgi:hypothetical protein
MISIKRIGFADRAACLVSCCELLWCDCENSIVSPALAKRDTRLGILRARNNEMIYGNMLCDSIYKLYTMHLRNSLTAIVISGFGPE